MARNPAYENITELMKTAKELYAPTGGIGTIAGALNTNSILDGR